MGDYNRLSTVGALLMGVAIAVFAVNVLRSRRDATRWQRPVVRQHARVVRDVAASAENWTEPLPYVSSARPLRDLRISLEEGDVASPWLRLCRWWAAAAVLLAVVSGAAALGTPTRCSPRSRCRR